MAGTLIGTVTLPEEVTDDDVVTLELFDRDTGFGSFQLNGKWYQTHNPVYNGDGVIIELEILLDRISGKMIDKVPPSRALLLRQPDGTWAITFVG